MRLLFVQDARQSDAVARAIHAAAVPPPLPGPRPEARPGPTPVPVPVPAHRRYRILRQSRGARRCFDRAGSESCAAARLLARNIQLRDRIGLLLDLCISILAAWLRGR